MATTPPFDPYKAPQANLDAAPSDPAAPVPGAVVQLLAQTRPWVKLVSVLFFIALGLMVIAFVFIFAAIGGLGRSEKLAMTAFIPLGILMLLYLPPTLFLWQYAGHIRRLQAGGGMRSLEEALASQKSFWKYVGILAVVVLVLYFVGIGFGGLFGAMMRR